MAVLVDGLPFPELRVEHEALVDGDALCYSVAAAGVVAKVVRDRLMRLLALAGIRATAGNRTWDTAPRSTSRRSTRRARRCIIAGASCRWHNSSCSSTSTEHRAQFETLRPLETSNLHAHHQGHTPPAARVSRDPFRRGATPLEPHVHGTRRPHLQRLERQRGDRAGALPRVLVRRLAPTAISPRRTGSGSTPANMPPLSGNHVFPVPFGDIHSPNLTPDTATRHRTPHATERSRDILRHGVRADNRAAFPFMEFQHLSDADIVALLSFLRSQPPVAERGARSSSYNLMGKALMAFVIQPESPAAPPPAATPAGATVERGAYLANSVSSCVACHTNRSKTGEFVGAEVRRRAGDGHRGRPDARLRDAEPDARSNHRTHLLPGRKTTSWRASGSGRILPAALMPWARLLPHDRRRPARDLPVPAIAAAECPTWWVRSIDRSREPVRAVQAVQP